MTKPIEEEPLEDEEEEEPLEDDDDEEDEEEVQGLSIDPRVLAAVTGQVTDATGINWPFAVLQFFLVVPSGQKPIDLATGLVIPTPPPIVAGANALFTINLQANSTIVPDSQWCLTIFPFNDMMAGQTLQPFTVSGALNLTARIATQLAAIDITTLVVPLSHNGAVGRSSFNGSTYFDVVTQQLMVRNPATGAYLPIGPTAAVPQVYPAAGLAVSTGTAWQASISPAFIPPVFLGNTATRAATPKIISGADPLVAGSLHVTYAMPFTGTIVNIYATIVSGNAPGVATPNVWVTSGGLTNFVVDCSDATSTATVFWMAIGNG